MKQRLLALAAAAVLTFGIASGAQATVVNFDNPAAIDIAGNIATYTESGFSIQGQAADFLTLDNGAGNGFLVGGFAGAQPFSLFAASGGAFRLTSFDFDFFDLGDPAGVLAVSGLLNGVQVAAASFSLNAPFAPGSAILVGAWTQLTEVRFSATSGFQLDNINVSAVPEPSSVALAGAALSALALSRLRRRLVA